MVRLGINGFGRIGRQVLKAVLERHPQALEVVAVNDILSQVLWTNYVLQEQGYDVKNTINTKFNA